MVQTLWKQSGSSLRERSNRVTISSRNSTSVKYPRKIKICPHKNLHTNIHSNIIQNNQKRKRNNHQSDEQINKMWSTHTMEYCSAMIMVMMVMVKMVMITLYAIQKKRHRCTEQTFGLCGRRRGWDVSREQHVYHL